MINLKELETFGYTTIQFEQKQWLDEIQEKARRLFPCDPTLWHEVKNVTQDEHLKLAHELNAVLNEGDFVKKLVLDNLKPFQELIGPNLDIQSTSHLRVSRPEKEEDFVDWHRDVFYGNSPWEMNLWFPVFPLEKGADLLYVEGSHVLPAENIREVSDTNTFRQTVKKGSIAHDLGYVYGPKTDDTISELDQEKIRSLSPKYGNAVLFFGCGIHRAINLSTFTRVTLDVRIRDARAPTKTKPGYYSPLCRGIVERCASQFLGNRLEVPSDIS